MPFAGNPGALPHNEAGTTSLENYDEAGEGPAVYKETYKMARG